MQQAEYVVERSQQQVDNEEELIRLSHDGKTIVELCNLTDILTTKGLIVED